MSNIKVIAGEQPGIEVIDCSSKWLHCVVSGQNRFVPIIHMFDRYGEPTTDPSKAYTAVAGEGNLWFSLALTADPMTVH